MTRANALYRPAGLAFGLLILVATGGCAHFRNAEVRAQERAGVQHTEPPVAEAVPAPPMAAEPPAPAPPAPAPPAAAAAPSAPPPEVAVQATPVPPVPAASPAEPVTPVAPVAREPAPEPPVAVPPAPRPAPASAAPATNNAIIIFANTPGARCGMCETLKISVAPSGQVLMERGSWTAAHSNWRYKRSRANVGPDRASAFASSLSADRPVGTQTVGGASCTAPANGDESLSVEWIEADRDDRLTARFGCAGDTVAERLRHAPDLLGLRQLAFP